MTNLKLQKLQKGDTSAAHLHLGDVLVGNLFVIFAVSFAVNSKLQFFYIYNEICK